MSQNSTGGEPENHYPSIGPKELARWAEALSGVARTGLGFTQNQFEVERYEEILHIAAEIKVHSERKVVSSTLPIAEHIVEIRQQWLSAVGSGVAGYATPKVAVGAVVGNDDGEILLIQRADSGIWLYPTGWADIGYSPSEVAVKEVQEETGIRCQVIRPLAIVDGFRSGLSRIPFYSLVFLCQAKGGSLSPHPLECLDAGWFNRDNLPEPLARGDIWADSAFDAIEGNDTPVSFDQPRTHVWNRDTADPGQ